jgi:hypothetical protein
MATATSFTKGEVIKNAKVTPSGIPPFTKPINKGIEEQEQNGVIAPKKDAHFFCGEVNAQPFDWEIGIYHAHKRTDKKQEYQYFYRIVNKKIDGVSQVCSLI